MTSFLWIIYVLAIGTATRADTTMKNCGGTLTATRGIIQTPDFPKKFDVPLTCVWIIDASEFRTTNASIIIYFTQQYVLSGLKFTEYHYYADDYQAISNQQSFEYNENAVTQNTWVRFNSAYLKINFTINSLHGTHLRALDRLLDVYGFNITYEIDNLKPYQCNALQCRFLGNCYAKYDYSSYYCSCFPGFIGDDCGLGPLCQDDKKFCENGGTCKHMGDTAVTCLCPKGFKGNKCEIQEIEDYSGCSQEDDVCDSECIFSDQEENVCKCSKQNTKSIQQNHENLSKYEATLHLVNNSQYISDNNNNNNGERDSSDNISIFLEKQVST